MSEQWRQHAACRNVDLSVFFPSGGDTYAAAAAACAACPVRTDCLADALRVFDVEGYRGGTTGDERARLLRGQRTRKAAGERLDADIHRLREKRMVERADRRPVGCISRGGVAADHAGAQKRDSGMRRRANWLEDRAQERARAIAACPAVANPEDTADNAVLDGLRLAEAVRDRDPREVWGRLAIWATENPLRLIAATWALAAMLPSDRTSGELLEWTDTLGSPDRVGSIRCVSIAPPPPREVTHEEHLRAARAAYVRGCREEWVVVGNREYDRLRKQRHRDRCRARSEQKGAA